MKAIRLAVCVIAVFVSLAAHGATVTVSNTNDSGAGSLRQAVLDANSGTCANPCTIQFATPLFTTPQTINLSSSLTITAANVMIDGFSGGATGTPNANAFGSPDGSVQNVVLNGASTTCCAVISISGAGAKIRGLVIQDGLTGITVSGNGSATITGNKIGTNQAGTAAVANSTGILVSGTSATAQIGGTATGDRNLISGNGVGISLQTANNVVIGNYIGVQAGGTVSLPNGTGIAITNSNNQIGSTLGNVVSGNTNRGIEITVGSGNQLYLNRVGTAIHGLTAVPNGSGILIGGGALPSNNVVGAVGAANTISGNGGDGIHVNSSNGSNTIAYNNIGMSFGLSGALGNGGVNIALTNAGTGNSIQNNVIANAGSRGISIAGATNTMISNNSIGYVSGVSRPNAGEGIYISAATGTTSILQNIIRTNGLDGVDVDGAIIGVVVKMNEIANNGGIGIDLHAGATAQGATANDAGDPDSSAGNHLQNYPAIAKAVLDGATASDDLTVTFNVDSSSISTTNSIYVEAFEADTDGAEGFRTLGGQCYLGNNLTNQTLAITAAGLTPGEKIVMTATSYTDSACGGVNEGTSEFTPGFVTTLTPGLVVNTNDSGTGSLRQAISDANAGTCTSPCTITFNIPTSDPGYNATTGVYTIKPATALPTILRDNTIVDGSTQVVYGGNTNPLGPEIEINGALTPASSGITIGGSTAGQGNNIEIRSLIVNGFTTGVFLGGSVTLNNIKLYGNYIGTDRTGAAAVPNAQYGVFLQNNTIGTQIGAANMGNVISGNGIDGIYFFNAGHSGAKILGNFIGTDPLLTTPVPNGGNGIFGSPQSAQIGSTGTPGEENVIAHNAGDGIFLLSNAALNSIRGNVMHDNGGLGIDLISDGVTPNDPLDSDAGANGLQNFPVLTGIAYNSGPNQTVISGTLNSIPSTTFDVDFYANTAVDPSGNGEGQTFLGTNTVTTDASGNAPVSLAVTGNYRSSNVTATASRVAGADRETSEFSAPPPNAAPVANNDSAVTNEDTPVTFDPRTNDTDANNDALSITGNTTPSSGSVLCSATSCTYTPASNFFGTATFDYTVDDGFGGTDTATVTVTINAVDDPPVVTNDTLTVTEDASGSVNVLTNDSDPDSTLTVSGFTQGANGGVTCSPSGLCTYTPNPNFSGSDSFTYTATDGVTPASGTVNVTITAVPDPPVANNDTITTNEDTPGSVNVLTNDTDPDSTPTVSGNTQGANGGVTCSPTGTCTYTPNANFFGSDTFSYTIFDGTSSSTANVNVTVNAVDDPPVANDDAISTAEDTPFGVNVLSNDTDPDSALTVNGNTQGANGSVTCSPGGFCNYTPNPNFNGTDSFTYTVTDGVNSDTGTVNVTISAQPDPPSANNDTITTNEDTPGSVNVLANDVDPDSTPTVTGHTQGVNGAVTCSPSGTCTYSPNANFFGTDSFNYTISDGTNADSATVNVTVNSVNDAPITTADTINTNEDTPGSVNVLTNDSDPDSTLTVSGFTQGANGSVTCSPSGLCTYTPNPNFTGSDAFQYTAFDGTASVTGNVSVLVAMVNDPPVANNDTLVTNEDTPGSVNVLTNDADPDSTPTVTANTQGANGSVTCSPSGTCTYTPNANFNGTDSFTYTISDGTSTSTATVNVTVNPVNDPPVANDDTLVTSEDTVGMVNVLANDTDPDSARTVQSNTNGTNGTASCSPTGTCTYTPNPNFSGTDAFNYTITDGTSTSTATVHVTVTAVNDPPVANNDALTTAEDTPGTVNVLTNDVDPDSTPTVVSWTNGAGSVSCTPTGNCTYTPAPNFTGIDSFTYTISDGTSTSTASVSVTVTAVNDPPVANTDVVETQSGTAVSFNVLSNDSDPEGDALTVNSNTAPANGTATCSPSGNCTYTPNAGFSGTDTFTYQLKDSANNSATGTVQINVLACRPDTITFFLPRNGQTNVPTSGRLQWNDIGATSYAVYLGPINQGGCDKPFASSSQPFVDYSGLLPNTQYVWKVIALTAGCPDKVSECITFTTGTNCNIAGPTLIRPTGTTASPFEFEWTAVSGATSYRVFANNVEIGTTTDTKFVATIPTDGPVSWYVVAVHPTCGDLRSNTAQFNLCNRPGTPLAAVVQQTTSGQNYKVEWEPVPNAVRYEIQQSQTSDFANPNTITTDKTFEQFRHEVTTEPRAFFYRVRAFSACSQLAGDYSPVVRVVIVPLPPKDTPNPNANVPAGSTQVVIQEVFVPGEPNQTLFFKAAADRPWLTVMPESGLLPPQGVTLQVLADPTNLPNGTFTATVIVTVSDVAFANGRTSANATSVKPIPVSISLVTPVSPVAAKPSPTNDALIIPSVGHLDGINSHWQSDIRVTNTAATSTRYQLTFTPMGGNEAGVKQTTITIGGGETTALDDVVRNWYGLGTLGDGTAGMLEIKPLDGVTIANTVASSRTYNVTDNGTLGQFIPAIPFAGFIGKSVTGALPQVLGLQQIAQSSAFRTNVGVVEASGNPVSVVLSIFNSAGVNVKDIAVDLKAGEQKQLNSVLAANGITLDDGRVEVKVTDGIGKVTAYASVVDNKSLDPMLVSGMQLGTQQANRWVVPGVADLNTGIANWRTDMRIFNSALASQNATLTFHPIGGAPITSTLSLAPNEVRTLDDIVKSVFKVSNVGGAVHVDTANSASLVVSGRTYNLTSDGTFGQFIPAVTANEAVARGGRQLNILQVEDSPRYRTNLGLSEVSGRPVTVEVAVIMPETKATPIIQVPLAANEFRQLSIIKDLQLGNVYNARLAIRVIDGDGRVTAYGSVVDMLTQDPTYVPAQ